MKCLESAVNKYTMFMGWGINYDSQWRRSKRKETEKQKEAVEKMQLEKRGEIVVEERLGLGGSGQLHTRKEQPS
jgi:predicted NUDIX family phosphoesterase